MQGVSQKRAKKKPQLVIQTGQDKLGFKRKPVYRNQVQIKPLMSAKNRHQLKTAFNFAQSPLNLAQKQQTKLRALQRLQSQKTQLMRSLQILKQGAVSAILEKQEQIAKLKQQMSHTSQHSREQEDQVNARYYEKELELKEAYRKELEEEVEELRKELRRERIRYEAELFEKQEIIGSLCGELNQSYHRIEEMEREGELKTERLRNIELENLSLLKELETSQNNLNTSFFLNLSNVTQKSHPRFTSHSRMHSQHSSDLSLEQPFNADLSCASTIPLKKHSEHFILNEDQEFLSNSFISQKIELIKEKHQQEMERMKQLYESKIIQLQGGMQEEKHAGQEDREGQKIKRIMSVDSLSSLRSDHTSKSSHSQRGIKLRTNSQSTLSRDNRHLQIQPLALQHRMQAILEKTQQQQAYTPRLHISLKQQILEKQQSQQPYDTLTNHSQLHSYFNNRSSQRQLLANCDTLSQFTANHFEYPLGLEEEDNIRKRKLFMRTNSIATFEGVGEEDTRTANSKIMKIASVENNIGGMYECQTHQRTLQAPRKALSRHQHSTPPNHIRFSPQSDSESSLDCDVSKEPKTPKGTLKKDIMLFCVGLVTGGTLIGVGSKIFNK